MVFDLTVLGRSAYRVLIAPSYTRLQIWSTMFHVEHWKGPPPTHSDTTECVAPTWWSVVC